nr:hypothetical protein [Spirillospora albida]
MCGFQVGGDLSGAFVDVLDERLAGIIQLFKRIQHPRPATTEIRDLGFQGCDMRFMFTQMSIVQPDEQRLKTLPAMGAEDLPIEEVVQPRDERLFTDPHHCGMPFRQVRAFRAADVVQPSPIVLAEHPAFAVGTGDEGPQDVRVFGVFGIGSAGTAARPSPDQCYLLRFDEGLDADETWVGGFAGPHPRLGRVVPSPRRGGRLSVPHHVAGVLGIGQDVSN